MESVRTSESISVHYSIWNCMFSSFFRPDFAMVYRDNKQDIVQSGKYEE